MRLTSLVLAGALVAAGAAATPASAASKKPISKSYAVTAPAPDPTNWADLGGVAGYSVCAQRIPNSFQKFSFTAPATGRLKVSLTGFTGDWDLLVTDAKGNEVTAGGSDGRNTPATQGEGDENVTVKVKKARTTYNLIACNWVGGPTGTLAYTFTYA
jgi:hypothetical protein